MSLGQNVSTVACRFEIEGELSSVVPHGSGHINDTYCATFQRAEEPRRFILQRINTRIFKTPVALMENIGRVTAHLAARANEQPDIARRVLTLIPSLEGRAWHTDVDGNYWRMYRFIDNAKSYDAVESIQQAFEAARAFGNFQKQLVDLPAPRLLETIPDFHNTPKRLAVLEQAIATDVANRAAMAQTEINFALARRSIVSALLDANLPERVTHNDTKFNNVLLDDATGEAMCVIDLDTVMPGLAPYDFGDMVRTTTNPAQEDEQDLSKVAVQFHLFEALVRGYLEGAGGFLTKLEKQHLVLAGKLITFEQGVRFLTDHLLGDLYYKIHRDGHNLDRCRAQFKLVESIELQEERMEQLVSSIG